MEEKFQRIGPRALGPKFIAMLDDVTPDESDDSSEETSDGTEI